MLRPDGPEVVGKHLILLPRADIQHAEPMTIGEGRLTTLSGRPPPSAVEALRRKVLT